MITYKSKLGKGLLSFVAAILLLAFYLSTRAGDSSAILTTGLINVGVMLFVLFLYLNTKYVIDGNRLIVHNGLHKIKIDIMKISSLKEVTSFISAPAFSTDRLKIKSEGRTITYISPVDADAFIADILERNPQIKVIRRK